MGNAFWHDDMSTPTGSGKLVADTVTGGIGYEQATIDSETGEIAVEAKGSLSLGLYGAFIVTSFGVSTSDVVKMSLGVLPTTNQCLGNFDIHHMLFIVGSEEFRAVMELPASTGDECTETSEEYTATVPGFYNALLNTGTATIRFMAPDMTYCEE